MEVRATLLYPLVRKKVISSGIDTSRASTGPKWKPGFTKTLWTWTPSIAVCNILIYDGETYPEWKGDVLVTSLKYRTLYRLDFENGKVINQHVVFEDKIER